MIPGILLVKCYNGIMCACIILHILFALINTNKHFWCHCRGHNWRKGLDHQHTTSFSRITPILLNCGIRQDSRRRFDLAASFHKKRRNIEEPRVPEHSRSINIGTLPSHRFVQTYIFSNHVQIGEKGRRHKNSNHISSYKYRRSLLTNSIM